MGQAPCENNGLLKCATCSIHGSTTINWQEDNSLPWDILRSGNVFARRMRNYRMIRKGYKNISGISHFQALSPHVKERYEVFGYPADKISIIPNMFDDHFNIAHQSDFSEPFNILFVGTLRHRKGADRLIDIAQKLHREHECEFNLSIAGDGDLRPTLEREINKKKLSNNITLHGHIPYNQLPTMYSKHDLFLYTGRWDEPFGRVFLEAMGAGTPIFSTDVGSVSEIIGDCGQTVPYTSADEFTQELTSVLDPAILKSYSEQTESQLRLYSPETVTEEFVKLYARV
jgi:glycosyltransferase involved in cell wall biosynthesis